MSIKTDLTQEDYSAFVKHVARSLSVASGDKTIRRFICIAIGLGVGFAVSVFDLTSQPGTLAAMFFGAVTAAFILMVLISIIFRRQTQRMRPEDDGYILGAQETSLEEEGIRQSSAYHEAIFQWSLVCGVAITEKHVFIMLDRIAGIILPRRAFSSESQLEQFVSEIERRAGKKRT